MLSAVYGSAEFDQDVFLFEELRLCLDKNIRAYVLVPEQFSVFTERKVIKRLGARAQRCIEVLTFSRLAGLILERFGPLRLNYVDGAEREIVAARALQLIEKKLLYFSSNTAQHGFPSLLARLVSEFKRYGHPPETIKSMAGEIEDDELSRKLHDLHLFYETYNTLIEKIGSDAEDNLSLCLPKLKLLPQDTEARLYISEFKSFTPLETEVIGTLTEKLGEVCMILSCDSLNNPSAPFAGAAETYRRLKQLALSLGVPAAKPRPLTVAKERSSDLSFVLKNYFDLRASASPSSPRSIHFLSPAGSFDEAEQAARIINRLIREKNYTQSDFLLLAKDTEKYSGILPEIFESAGLSLFLDKRRSVAGNPFVRLLSAVLEILAFGFTYERIMNMARSGFVQGIDDEDADFLDNYILAAAPGHAVLSKSADWRYNPDKRTFDMDRINRIKNLITSPVFKLKSSISGRKTAADITAALFGLIADMHCEDTMRSLCREFADSGMVYLAEEYRMAWNTVTGTLARLGELMSDTYLSYERFGELFGSVCAEIKTGVSPQTIDGVMFSSVDLFRSSDTKVVIVLGVTDGVFPKAYGTEGLISDSERELLRSRGLELAQTAAEKTLDENVTVYNVLAAAQDEMYLMSPLTDDDGSALKPSRIVTRIRGELFSGAAEEDAPEAACENDILRELMAELAACGADAEKLSPKGAALYDIFSGSSRLSEFSSRLKTALSGYEQLSKEAVRRLYGKKLMLSASRLEKFNACAFAYFMRYGLAAQPRAEAAFDPLQLGSVLHLALERYFSEKSNNTDFSTVTKSDVRRDMTRIVEDIAGGSDEIMYQSSSYYRYLVKRMIGISSATAWETVKFFRISEFRPFGFEIKIGNDGTIPPVRVHTSLGEAEIEGFIDRADSAVLNGKRYFSIVDYKSSAKSLDPALAEAGVRFQPLVYAGAICASSDENRAAALLYQQMNDPIIPADKAKTEESLEKELKKNTKADGWVINDDDALNAFDKNNGTKECYISPKNLMSSEEMTEKLEAAQKKIAESAEGIFSGTIAINPYISRTFNACEFCDYSSVCGREQS